MGPDSSLHGLRILGFGTYDSQVHPRIKILLDGLSEHGAAVSERNRPLRLTTSQRVGALRDPRELMRAAARLLAAWRPLATRRVRPVPDVVVVGYLGHFDVVLARFRFPRQHIVLDHLVFAADTGVDRGFRGPRVVFLGALDRIALACADTIVVDTDEHRDMVPAHRRDHVVVVPVGATSSWFGARQPTSPTRGEPLSVVFFGTMTPLQGAPVIARALRRMSEIGVPVRATIVGNGQDTAGVDIALGEIASVRRIDWVDPRELPALVASHDVCLGIFGTGAKSMRVVPNKMYEGAAAGCALVTSDTAPQRRTLGDAARYVPPGDDRALAAALQQLALDPLAVAGLRRDAGRQADRAFGARDVVSPLVDRIARISARRKARE